MPTSWVFARLPITALLAPFRIAATSFLTLVDGNRPAMQHSLDEPKTVTLALVSQEVEGWLDYLRAQNVPIRNDLNWKPDQPHDGFCGA